MSVSLVCGKAMWGATDKDDGPASRRQARAHGDTRPAQHLFSGGSIRESSREPATGHSTHVRRKAPHADRAVFAAGDDPPSVGQKTHRTGRPFMAFEPVP